MGARTVRRIPIPSALSHQALREARRPNPPSAVLKRHAVEVEMIGRTRCVWLDGHLARQEPVIVHLNGGAYVSGPFASDWARSEERRVGKERRTRVSTARALRRVCQ